MTSDFDAVVRKSAKAINLLQKRGVTNSRTLGFGVAMVLCPPTRKKIVKKKA